MPLIAFKWTDKAVAELKRLWCKERASAAVAAQILSEKFGGYVTRNMVIGKAHRLGLKHSEGKVASTHQKKSQQVGVKKPLITQLAKIVQLPPQASSRLPVKPKPVDNSDGSRRIGLLDLRETTCRFPIDDPRQESFGYCGAPSPVGKPYCDHHHRIAYVRHQPPVSRKKSGNHHGMRVVQIAAY